MHDAHIFLGPSLELNEAQTICPTGFFHPPIQCGDIIRLFRLKPKLILIIDGFYETTPAVWHKEILLALERGISVWGAASMGALRAAELYRYGMKGYGTVFTQFKEGLLNDDDEVAVLHHNEHQGYTALNDAMVNIRATCELALKAEVLTLKAQESLLTYCKAQFYPYRSLAKAAQHFAQENPLEYRPFITWLNINGMVDLKRQDALNVLKALQSQNFFATGRIDENGNTLTYFLRELILFANTTPFKHQLSWLPDIEKKLQQEHFRNPKLYTLYAEVASFLQKLIFFSLINKEEMNSIPLLRYIKEHHLYSPEQEFALYKDHKKLPNLFSLLCQGICLGNLTETQIEESVPVLAHYYDLQEKNATAQKLLRIISILIFCINQHIAKSNATLSKTYFKHHLKQIKNWRGYTQSQLKDWLATPPTSREHFIKVITEYLMAYSVQSLASAKVHYHEWIYDAYSL